MDKTGTFEIECPNCKVKITVPYFKEVKPMTKKEIDQEIAEAFIELDRLGHIDLDSMFEEK